MFFFKHSKQNSIRLLFIITTPAAHDKVDQKFERDHYDSQAGYNGRSLSATRKVITCGSTTRLVLRVDRITHRKTNHLTFRPPAVSAVYANAPDASYDYAVPELSSTQQPLLINNNQHPDNNPRGGGASNSDQDSVFSKASSRSSRPDDKKVILYVSTNPLVQRWPIQVFGRITRATREAPVAYRFRSGPLCVVQLGGVHCAFGLWTYRPAVTY